MIITTFAVRKHAVTDINRYKLLFYLKWMFFLQNWLEKDTVIEYFLLILVTILNNKV